MRKIKFYLSTESKKPSQTKSVMSSACCTSTTIGDRDRWKTSGLTKVDMKA